MWVIFKSIYKPKNNKQDQNNNSIININNNKRPYIIIVTLLLLQIVNIYVNIYYTLSFPNIRNYKSEKEMNGKKKQYNQSEACLFLYFN